MDNLENNKNESNIDNSVPEIKIDEKFSINEKENTEERNISELNGTNNQEVSDINENSELTTALHAVNSNPSGEGLGNNADNLKSASFYTESFKKQPRTKNVGLFQLILVALISSILGGAAVGSFFQFVVPAVQPSTKSFFSSILPGKEVTSSTDNNSNTVKKVEIVQNSDSPVTAIAEKVSPSIVGIRITFKQRTFFFDSTQDAQAEGSGIILRSDGYIMTNYHVIENAIGNTGKQSANAKIEVILPNQKDKPYTAQVIGGDSKTDLAVIKIEASNLPSVELGNSDNLKVGELAVAIGNPAGLEYMGSVTVGVISGLNRTIPVEDGKELKLIQTDAAINPGNSGGALVNSTGQVIGINTAKMGGDGFEGLGFAIPVNKAKEITDSLIQFKYVKGRALLGISGDPNFTEEIAKQYDVPMGVHVIDVSPFSGASKAGIQIDDIITKFDSKAVKSVNEINEIKNKHKPGDNVAVEIYREGEYKTLQVQLTEDKG